MPTRARSTPHFMVCRRKYHYCQVMFFIAFSQLPNLGIRVGVGNKIHLDALLNVNLGSTRNVLLYRLVMGRSIPSTCLSKFEANLLGSLIKIITLDPRGTTRSHYNRCCVESNWGFCYVTLSV